MNLHARVERGESLSLLATCSDCSDCLWRTAHWRVHTNVLQPVHMKQKIAPCVVVPAQVLQTGILKQGTHPVQPRVRRPFDATSACCAEHVFQTQNQPSSEHVRQIANSTRSQSPPARAHIACRTPQHKAQDAPSDMSSTSFTSAHVLLTVRAPDGDCQCSAAWRARLGPRKSDSADPAADCSLEMQSPCSLL